MKIPMLKRLAASFAAALTALASFASFADAEPPAFVSTDAVFWLDAAATDTLTVDENNQVTRWNSRVGSNYARTNTTYGLALPTYDTTSYGLTTVDFGPALEKSTAAKDLQFDQISNVHTVFWVTKIEKSPNAFWLGCMGGNAYPFSRGGGHTGEGAYASWRSNYSNKEGVTNFYDGVSVVADILNEVPSSGRFLVVAADVKDGVSVNSIGCDRNNIRAGGKQLSELIVFTRTLSAEERIAVTQYLQQKWLPAEESETEQFIAQNASFWLDAAARTTMTIDGSGQVTSWGSRVGNNVAAKSSSFGYPSYNTTTYGIPTVDFGAVNSSKDLAFTPITGIKTVFMATKIAKNQAAFWLGYNGKNIYNFHRGTGGQYADASNSKIAAMWNGTNAVALTDYPDDSRFLVVGMKMSADSSANSLTCDRATSGVSGRNGGKQLSELIVFEKELSEAERIAVTKYLQKKWIPAEGETEEYIRANASFWLDASATDTMDINENKEVTRWYSRTMDGNSAQTYGSRKYWTGSAWGTDGTFTPPVYDNMTYGFPTVDFGPANTAGGGVGASGRDLTFTTRITGIGTAFWVVKIENSSAAFWLGDKSDYGLGRGDGSSSGGTRGSYAIGYDGNKFARIWNGTTEVENIKTAIPDDSRFIVVAANMVEGGASAQFIGCDRWCNNVGGKKLSEVITFNSVLSDEKRTEIIEYLQAKWAPKNAEQFIRQNAAFWLDAAAKDTLTIDENNQVSRWNSRVGSNYARQNGSMALPAYDATSYGFPTVDFGSTGSNKDLAFTQITGIRMVFMATKIVNNGNAFWLGDGSNYYFHRGEQGQYAVRWSDGNGTKFDTVWNGTSEVNMLVDHPDATKHNVVCMQMSEDAKASTITKDRNQNGRNGGKQLSELIVFTKDLSDEERIAVTEYLQAKWGASEFQWETRMAMETPDDGEWRSDLYRVFGADASVPALGAVSAGVGFSADATLDGGQLSLGLAGFYAADGVTATIAAPIISDTRVFGPGTVVFDPAQTLTGLYVSTNSTVVLKPGASIADGAVFRKGAKIVIDVTGYDYGDFGYVSLGSFSLPDTDGGTDILDYVTTSLPASEGYGVTYNATEGRLEVSRGTKPVAAKWKGGADAKAASNWECYDVDGNVINNPAPVPGRSVATVTLDADLDMRGWGETVFADGVNIDLKGHSMYVDNLDGTSFARAAITNSVAGTTATLDVTVANGVAVSDSTATIVGNIKFVKSGAGAFVARVAQSYTGGTEVQGGTLKAGAAGTTRPLGVPVEGAAQSDLTIASGATFDLNGNGGWSAYRLVMAGGTVDNSTGKIGVTTGTFTNVVLTADSKFNAPNHKDWPLTGKDYAPVTIDFGENHTLDIAIDEVTMDFTFAHTIALGTGRINVVSGGNLVFGAKGVAAANDEIHLENIDLRDNAAMCIYAPVNVRDYIADYGNGGSNHFNFQRAVGLGSTEELKVHGRFVPPSYDVFYGCTMQNGSTIDLSRRVGRLPLNLANGRAWKEGDPELLHGEVSFAGGTVTVDLSAFEANLKTMANAGTMVLSWSSKPENVSFKPDDATARRGYALTKTDEGLKLVSAGFIMFLR